MGWGEDEFYLPRPHTIFSNTYPLPYPYSAEMRNRISSMSPTGLGIPASFPSLKWIIFFLLKIKVFFIPERKVVMTNALFSKKMTTIDDYGDEEERG